MAKPKSKLRNPSSTTFVRVWDAPTRLFHWSIVCLIALSWFTAEKGLMKIHLYSGLALLSLLLFRIVWGIVGSTTARFSDFIRSPLKVIGYFKGLMGPNKPLYAGHNPAGGLMVMALIAVLLAQVGTGLFANDGIRFNGPLAMQVSTDLSDRLTRLHGLIFNLILCLVWAHLVAVFFYLLVKEENLIKPMFTGRKPHDHVPPGLSLKFVHWAIALGVLAAAAGLVAGILLL